MLASVPVHIVGAGPEERALRKLAGELGGEVAFLGYRTGAELDEAIRAARAVVLPSEWYENAPMSIMEAYALGRPVIGARIGGIPELIRHGETGAVFESGNAEDLADVMRQFTNMEDSAVADMGRQGRRWVEMEFTAQKYRYRILELYRELGVRF